MNFNFYFYNKRKKGNIMKGKKIQKLMLIVCVIGFALPAWGAELTVYSARKEHLVKPLFDEYTKQTGVKVKYLTDKAPALLQRLKAEGKRSKADILITVDAGNLWHAANENILQPVDSDVLKRNIPAHLRDPGGKWFGLSIRARTIVFNTQKVKPEDLQSYQQLASSQWKDRLVLRTSKKVYNQSLVAMLIAENGHEATKATIQGWVNNLAAPPFSNDTKVLESIAAGLGDVGIVNTYYYGRLIKKNPELPLALFWPNQDEKGTHVNVSGAGVTTYSKNKEEAVKFLEWLSSTRAQSLFADANMEYPVNPNVEAHPTVLSWGTFKPNMINLANAGKLQKDAIKLMDEAGYR